MKSVPAILAAAVLTISCAATRQTPALRLGPCAIPDGPADAYCGALTVWENRNAAAGRQLAVKVVVLPKFRLASAAEPLFVLAGGPGQGAASLAETFQRLLRPVQRDRDIVLVDGRGTGGSHALKCGAGRAPETGSGLSVGAERLRECLASYRNYADVTQYTTEAAMDDLDDVRASLGYPKIAIYGVSFGSRAAMVYLRRHPDKSAVVVLDSVTPPDNHLPFFVARDSQRAFDLLVRDCDRDEGCRTRFPNLRTQLDRVLARLADEPLHIRDPHPRTGQVEESDLTRPRIAGVVLAALYVPEFAAALPLVIDEADHGDFSGMLALETVLGGLRSTLSFGLQYSVLCAEDITHTGPGEIPATAGSTFLGDAPARAAEALCKTWPVATVDADYWRPTASEIPALLISGEIDPVTPPSWGDVVKARWPHAQHLVVPGAGHNPSASACGVDAIAQFLTSGGSANVDARCLTDHRRPPFVIGPSGPALLTGASR